MGDELYAVSLNLTKCPLLKHFEEARQQAENNLVFI